MSDGELLPAELARRAEAMDHQAIAITDHVDWSNIDSILPRLVRACEKLSGNMSLQVIPGAELTHVPPQAIPELARRARSLGARIIVVHGETLVEPVQPGTNRVAVECNEVDILSHPGLIPADQAELARENGVYLELTSRKGHCLSNGWVAKVARETGAKLLLNSDAHSPEDLLPPAKALSVAMGAGLTKEEAEQVLVRNPLELIKKL